jgi:membrane-associated phospholipid phosphatase
MTIETSYPEAQVETTLPVIPMTRDRRAARWVSRIASPPLMAMAVACIVAEELAGRATSKSAAWGWALFISVFTIFLPSCYVLLQVKRGKVTDFDVYLRGQRFWPYIVSLVCAGISWLVLAVAHAPRLYIVISGASVSVGVIMFLVNQRWKISAHAAGSASLAVILWQLFGVAGSPFLLIIPLVSWSRVRLGRHSLLQVIAGSALGAGVFLIAMAIWY